MSTIKSFTSPKQSKQLAEILPIESADMAYWKKSYRPNDYAIMAHHTKELQEGFEAKGMEYIPCWSLVALEKLMPFQLIENNNRYGFYQVKGFNKQGETYRFGYKSNDNSFLFETSWSNNLIDAAFEMICWLKENNKI